MLFFVAPLSLFYSTYWGLGKFQAIVDISSEHNCSKKQHKSVADPECARGGGVSHILAEKRSGSFTLFKKMHKNSIF